jgi:hypothetical protein
MLNIELFANPFKLYASSACVCVEKLEALDKHFIKECNKRFWGFSADEAKIKSN